MFKVHFIWHHQYHFNSQKEIYPNFLLFRVHFICSSRPILVKFSISKGYLGLFQIEELTSFMVETTRPKVNDFDFRHSRVLQQYILGLQITMYNM
jgi:hypothetical protein